MYAATVRAAVIDVVTTIFIIGAGNVATVGAAAEVPTFTNEVAPILYENCVVCHREGENAPMSLVTYRGGTAMEPVHQEQGLGWGDASLARRTSGWSLFE